MNGALHVIMVFEGNKHKTCMEWFGDNGTNNWADILVAFAESLKFHFWCYWESVFLPEFFMVCNSWKIDTRYQICTYTC